MCRAPRAARQQDNNNEMKMEIQKNRSMYEYYFPPHTCLCQLNVVQYLVVSQGCTQFLFGVKFPWLMRLAFYKSPDTCLMTAPNVWMTKCRFRYIQTYLLDRYRSVCTYVYVCQLAVYERYISI